jgi:2-enoate reductase
MKRDAGEDFPIIYRFGITHHLEGGREEEEGLWIAEELEKMGYDALHVDAGCYETHWWPHPPQYFPPGCMVDVSEKIKKVTSLPVIAVGRLHYPEAAERAVAEGKADFIAIGRGLLSEPDWVNKVASGKTDELIPCLGCHEGCKWQMIAGYPTSCAINPSCGHEIEWALTPLKEKRSLLVIGGGPGGIEAARVGAKRGFEVTLWEASDKLGGNLWPAGKPDIKHDIMDYIKYLEGLVKRLPIEVVLNKKATAEDVKNFGADYVVIATGAQMEKPPFGNGASDKVFSVMEVLNGVDLPGDKILVMGGGVIGCETALYLAREGKKVTISTRRDKSQLAEDLYDHNNHDVLIMMMEAIGIEVLSETVPVRVEDDGVVVDQGGTEKKIPVDCLVFSGRMIPENGLSKSLEGMDNVFSVGDCVDPERIMEAVWTAFKTVREIEP